MVLRILGVDRSTQFPTREHRVCLVSRFDDGAFGGLVTRVLHTVGSNSSHGNSRVCKF